MLTENELDQILSHIPKAEPTLEEKIEKLRSLKQIQEQKRLLMQFPGWTLALPEVRAVYKQKYILLDVSSGPHSWSGMWMVEKDTQLIFHIKSKYGVINRKKCYGSLDRMIADYEAKA